MLNNKVKKLNRLIAKTSWIVVVLVFSSIAWLIIYAFLWSVLSIDDNTSLPTALTSSLLAIIFITLYIVFRKSSTTLLRWTSKAMLLIAPLVVISSISLLALPTLVSTDKPTTDTQKQQEDQHQDDISKKEDNIPGSNTLNALPYDNECFDRYIPFNTIYQDSSLLYIGETEDSHTPPIEGIERVCTENGVSTTTTVRHKTDRLIYRGTKDRANGQQNNNKPYEYKPPNVTYPGSDNCHIADFYCN